MSTITVQVTQFDIDNGERTMHCDCPVALAARRALAVPRVSVAGDLLAYLDEGSVADVDHEHYSLTTEVLDWIVDFDLKRPVKPFSFTITRI
jgi:hypothetical protein